MHLRETLVSFIKPYSSFEPAYFLFHLAQGYADFAEVNLYLQKTCRNQTWSEPDLSKPCDNERHGIEFVASIYSKYAIFLGFTTIITEILMSAWSDKAPNRPKVAILLLMLFRLVQLIGLCFQTYFWHWSVLATVSIEFLLHTSACVRVISRIYICGTTSIEDRTFRLTLLYVLHLLSSLISSGSSGYVLHSLGFFYTYVLCLVLHVISVIYAAVFMKQLAFEDPDKHSGGFIKSICELFDLRSVVQAFRLVFGKRAGSERITIILLTAISVLSYFTYYGELSVLYLYLRYRFSWNEKAYGVYCLYKIMGICVGSMICLGISKYLKVADSALGMFAAFWDTLASLAYFFAGENWQLYLGQLYSVHMAVCVFVIASMPVYSFLFAKTMDFEPASFFILSTSINLIICIFYGVCHVLIKKMPKKD